MYVVKIILIMKKIIVLLTFALILSSCGSIQTLQSSVYDLQNRVSKLEVTNENLEKTVYSLQTTLDAIAEANKNAQNPASYQSTQPSKSSISSATTTVKTYSRQRCQAITKAGTQCKRTAAAGSKYCWQHQR